MGGEISGFREILRLFVHCRILHSFGILKT